MLKPDEKSGLMLSDTIREPTPEECSAGTQIAIGMFATWYPQMGGYVGRGVVCIQENSEKDDCFEVYVWHDGEFPFSGEGGRNPVRIHHCSTEQFREFADFVTARQKGE